MGSPTLAEVVAAIAGDPLTIDAPPSWSQGRTLYGGMTAALGWAAAARLLPDLPPLRSVHAAFVGPAAGRLTLVPEVLRQGKSATTIGVDVRGEQGLAARLTFFCGSPRASKVSHERVTAPAAPQPDDLPAVLGSRQGPTFAANYDIRHVSGGLPYSGGAPEFLMWARMKEAGGADPLVSLIALADVLPPASMPVFPEPGVISTLSWSFDLDRLPEDAGAWYLASATAETTADGYSRQAMDLWDMAGRRVLAGRQTVAIFV
ncbi:thioesterase family protein [Sphingomonas astaxanthinifaciens]|uniref:Acyl-CoA thioesterase n=2 Tax=Sphingomonas TaxID=13687 RepID=A0ABQ5Z4J8_9SPHN|nr:thioesterase family protein [Sphingomonas astaxanthinifaciens]GLR46926.1 acyl-CoA thioesterase [Sphingomonas astaxanthinifaciens DSM 22298]